MGHRHWTEAGPVSARPPDLDDTCYDAADANSRRRIEVFVDIVRQAFAGTLSVARGAIARPGEPCAADPEAWRSPW